MANRLTRSLRPLLAVVAVVGALAVAPGLAFATPDHHKTKPTVDSVQKQLGTLALRNTQLVEKYNQAQVAVTRLDKAAKAAQSAAAAAGRRYLSTRTEFVQIIQAQYEDQSFGAAGALFDSQSGTNYVDRLNTLNMVTDHTAQLVSQVTSARNTATRSATRAKHALSDARRQRDALGAKRKSVEKQLDKYRVLLATLNSAQRADYQRAANPAVSKTKIQKIHVTAAGTGAARRAVRFALDQVGKPYVFGAAGPGSYDCSGLTMASWAHAGVSLPHSAAEQYNYGHHVSRDDLEPGDLIFFYSPIGHVTIYIGDGMMVSAPTEGENVSVVPLSAFNSSYAGATRLT
ncbi:C40 family peptidase [uncultured Jatrophihabitans sp.]|uniref:C40 family peptidase n=1 Tax=uncultured Jatrophihabitans sp. TaxID=1610747 RepID=UPI0035CBC2EF